MPRRATERLSDQRVRAFNAPAGGATIAYDVELPGFGIRITANGVRSFVLNYTCSGRERRMTIGSFPTWSTTAAREEARRLRRKIDSGTDPMDEREAEKRAAIVERMAPTMADLFTRYDAEHLPRKSRRAAADDRSMWTQLILPQLGSMKVMDVKPDDIDALHREVSRTRPVRANRMVEVVRKAFNLAIRWEWRSNNPASGVHRNHEHKRTIYLSATEITALFDALSKHSEKVSANAIKLLALTGARRSEALSARWDMFDLKTAIWIKPSAHTKQRKEHRVPLSAPATQLISEILSVAKAKEHEQGMPLSPFIFPGQGDKPITDVKRTWLAVCKMAGLAAHSEKRTKTGKIVRDERGEPLLVWRPKVRIHDLRHTYASILASDGNSLPIIGALLGHTQPQTTARYAHLLDDPLRAATERAGEIISRRDV